MDLAIQVLVRLIECGGSRAAGGLGAELDISCSTLFRISRALAETGLLTVSIRGVLALRPLRIQLAQRRDAMLREEDAERGVHARGLSPAHTARATSFYVMRNRSRQPIPEFRRATVKHSCWISALSAKHAAHSATQQSADIEAFLDTGIDGLIVSAVSATLIAPELRDADRSGLAQRRFGHPPRRGHDRAGATNGSGRGRPGP